MSKDLKEALSSKVAVRWSPEMYNRLKAHVMEIERSDGKKEVVNAIRGFICYRCHLSTDAILMTVDGDKCNKSNRFQGDGARA